MNGFPTQPPQWCRQCHNAAPYPPVNQRDTCADADAEHCAWRQTLAHNPQGDTDAHQVP